MKAFHKTLIAVSVICAVALTVASTPLPAQASVPHTAVVSDNPSDTTPHIVLGTSGETIYAFAQIGHTMYAGGRFTQVQNPARTITYNRQNFFAFDSQTGQVSSLNLSFDGLVETIARSTDGQTLYIGGSFKLVNGVAHRALIKYDVVNNRISSTFKPPVTQASVSDVKVVNGSLLVAGSFAGYLLALNPTTGADTHNIHLAISGVINPFDVTRVRRFAVSPDGTRLVATGNFATVNGQSRRHVFELNLGFFTVLSSWHSPRFDVPCPSFTALTTAQGVDFSPDGSYFVIVAVGSYRPTDRTGLCDAAARFETANVSSSAQATWVNWTGGDSLLSVAITGIAVYVGGHQRWLDNPEGKDFAGPGAVSRPGIAAIDPVSGKALAWNPTKSRNHGTTELFATAAGLWVGSDGELFGGEVHAGIGFVPLPQPGPELRVLPFTSIDAFVNQQFTDFLGRPSTALERSPYVVTIANDSKNADQVIDEISHLSAVKQAPIIRLYRSYFRRPPDRNGLDFYTNRYRNGTSTLSQISSVFAGSSEFVRTYGSLSNTAFVNLVYQNVLGRTAHASEVTYWVNKLDSGSKRSAMMLFFSESSENQTKTRNLVDVVVTYRDMLQRIPTATELDFGVSVITARGLEYFIHLVRVTDPYASRFG